MVITKPYRTKLFLSLAYYVDSKLPLLVLADDPNINLMRGYNKLALYRPTEAALTSLKQEYNLTNPVEDLWIAIRK